MKDCLHGACSSRRGSARGSLDFTLLWGDRTHLTGLVFFGYAADDSMPPTVGTFPS